MFFKRNNHRKPSPDSSPERALTRILLKCNCKLSAVVEYILAATQEDTVCDYCPHKANGDCEDLVSCAPAVEAYLRERDGE